MPRLTYRGNVYQKSLLSEKRSEELKRVQGMPHTYRGAVYHYTSNQTKKDKEDTSLTV